MNKKTLILILFSLSVTSKGIGQTIVKPKVINSSDKANAEYNKPVEKATKTTNAVTTTYHVKDKEYYTKFIEALEVKKARMKENPEYDEKAKSLNWYEQINNEIAKAKEALRKLEEDEN